MSYSPWYPMAYQRMPALPGMYHAGYAFPHRAEDMLYSPYVPMGMMPGHMLPHGIPMQAVPDACSMNQGALPRVEPEPTTAATVQDDDQSRRRHQKTAITVFVGNISERATDVLLTQVLQECGSVVSWKRVNGATGKILSKCAFGFCEYVEPESALRAMRILHDWKIGDKNLVVKVDAKTQAHLEEYEANKRKLRLAGNAILTDSERDGYDSSIRTAIEIVLKKYESILTTFLPSEPDSSEATTTKEPDKENSKDNVDEDQNIDDVDLEDKKELIQREIKRFRQSMKKMEEERGRKSKAREQLRDRSRERELSRDRSSERELSDRSMERELSRDRSMERELSRDRLTECELSRDRLRERKIYRDRLGERKIYRDRSREREWSREHLMENEWARDSSKEHEWARETSKEHEWARDSSKEHEWARETSKEHEWARDSSKEHEWARDSSKEHESSRDCLSEREQSRERWMEHKRLRDRSEEREEMRQQEMLMLEKLREEKHERKKREAPKEERDVDDAYERIRMKEREAAYEEFLRCWEAGECK